jgi:hypothetical protein
MTLSKSPPEVPDYADADKKIVLAAFSRAYI